MKKFLYALLVFAAVVTPAFASMIADDAGRTRMGYRGENPTTRNRFGHRGENPTTNANQKRFGYRGENPNAPRMGTARQPHVVPYP